MNSSQENDKYCPACDFQKDLALLRESDFFAELPLEILKVLAYLCTREVYKKGDYLFNKGEDDGQGFYILTGKTGLVCEDIETQKPVIREFGPGTFLGGLSLLGKMRRLFSLKALEDTTCLLLTRQKFSRAVAQFPELTPRLFQAIINNIRSWEERLFLEHARNHETCCRIAGVSLI